MNATFKGLGIDRLGIEERLALVEEIWDSIAAESGTLPLTEAQRTELTKRIAEDDSNPDATVPWEDVKSATLARLGK